MGRIVIEVFVEIRVSTQEAFGSGCAWHLAIKKRANTEYQTRAIQNLSVLAKHQI